MCLFSLWKRFFEIITAIQQERTPRRHRGADRGGGSATYHGESWRWLSLYCATDLDMAQIIQQVQIIPQEASVPQKRIPARKEGRIIDVLLSD